MEARITEDWFKDDEHRAVFGFISRHYLKHGEVPTIHLLRAGFPDYTVVKIGDSLPPLVEQLQDRRNYGLTVQMLQEAGEHVEEHRDWKAALDEVQKGVQQILTESSTLQDIDLTKTWEDRLDAYDLRAENDGSLLGIPTGFKTIDLATSGWQPKQLVTVIATPKIGKSTLAMRMALNAWLAGYKVLFISFEMSNEEQAARHDSMLGGIPHTGYMRGTLDRNQKALLERALEKTEGKQSFVLSADINSVTTVSGIAAKIDQHDPDIVFVDGVYLMRDELGEPEGSPQALTNITRNLKRLAQRSNLPIIASTQALLSKVNKKRGVQADSIGYSSSFAQDSDVILGLQEDEHDEAMRELRVVMSRNCGRISTGLIWDWTTSTFEEPDDEWDAA
jgi:replicative DNA helicase